MNSIFIWLLTAIVFWVSGYLNFIDNAKSNVKEIIFFKPHIFFFFLCGMPKTRDIPRGTMIVQFASPQLFGLLIAVYGFFIDKYTTNLLNQVASYVIGFTFPAVICWLFIYYFRRASR